MKKRLVTGVFFVYMKILIKTKKYAENIEGAKSSNKRMALVFDKNEMAA